MERHSSSSYRSEGRGATPAVLVIDEDSDFREALCANLLEDGYLAYALDHAVSPLALGSVPLVDLVVTDAGGPRGSARAFAEAWHRVHPEVPILVVTTDPEATWDTWADGLGGVEVRRKPIDYEQIRSTLRALSARLGAED